MKGDLVVERRHRDRDLAALLVEHLSSASESGVGLEHRRRIIRGVRRAPILSVEERLKRAGGEHGHPDLRLIDRGRHGPPQPERAVLGRCGRGEDERGPRPHDLTRGPARVLRSIDPAEGQDHGWRSPGVAPLPLRVVEDGPRFPVGKDEVAVSKFARPDRVDARARPARVHAHGGGGCRCAKVAQPCRGVVERSQHRPRRSVGAVRDNARRGRVQAFRVNGGERGKVTVGAPVKRADHVSGRRRAPPRACRLRAGGPHPALDVPRRVVVAGWQQVADRVVRVRADQPLIAHDGRADARPDGHARRHVGALSGIGDAAQVGRQREPRSEVRVSERGARVIARVYPARGCRARRSVPPHDHIRRSAAAGIIGQRIADIDREEVGIFIRSDNAIPGARRARARDGQQDIHDQLPARQRRRDGVPIRRPVDVAEADLRGRES